MWERATRGKQDWEQVSEDLIERLLTSNFHYSKQIQVFNELKASPGRIVETRFSQIRYKESDETVLS